ncbi:MAG TPA: hypothetical protein V6D11_25105 [Waterburya sp.]
MNLNQGVCDQMLVRFTRSPRSIPARSRLPTKPLARIRFSPPSPPIFWGEYIQNPPNLGDLGDIAGFIQEV